MKKLIIFVLVLLGIVGPLYADDIIPFSGAGGGGGTTSPGGITGDLQFNDGGSFGGLHVGSGLSVVSGSLVSTGSGIGFPPSGVANSTGSAWGTSYQVGTLANNLIQLDSSARLPAVDRSQLKNLPSGSSYTFTSGLTETGGTVTNNLLTGFSGGQTVYGGTAPSENISIYSTTNATKGHIYLHDATIINGTTPISTFTVYGNMATSGTNAAMTLYSGTTSRGVLGQCSNAGSFFSDTLANDVALRVQTAGSGLLIGVGSGLATVDINATGLGLFHRPAFLFDVQPATITTTSFTRPWTSLNTAQIGAITGWQEGAAVWDNSGKVLKIYDGINLVPVGSAEALSFGSGLTKTGNTVTNDLTTGISGGQVIYGDTVDGGGLVISSTTSGIKGTITLIGQSAINGHMTTTGDINTGANVTVTKDTLLSGMLTVEESAEFKDHILADSLDVTNDAHVLGNLTSGPLSVVGGIGAASLTIASDGTIGNTFTVYGRSTLIGNTGIGATSTDPTVKLYVSGLNGEKIMFGDPAFGTMLLAPSNGDIFVGTNYQPAGTYLTIQKYGTTKGNITNFTAFADQAHFSGNVVVNDHGISNPASAPLTVYGYNVYEGISLINPNAPAISLNRDNVSQLAMIGAATDANQFVSGSNIGDLVLKTTNNSNIIFALSSQPSIMTLNHLGVGIMNTPDMLFDAHPRSVTSKSYTRPWPTLTSTQIASLQELQKGVAVYDSTSNALKIYNGSSFSTVGNALSFSAGLTQINDNIVNDLVLGKSGGQTINGGTGPGENLTIFSTTNPTKGSVNLVGNAHITGNIGIGGSLIAGSPGSVHAITGNTTINGDLTANNLYTNGSVVGAYINGNTMLAGALTAGTINTNGDATIGGNLTVTTDETITGNLNVTGTSHLTGSTIVGNSTTNISTFTVYGSAAISTTNAAYNLYNGTTPKGALGQCSSNGSFFSNSLASDIALRIQTAGNAFLMGVGNGSYTAAVNSTGLGLFHRPTFLFDVQPDTIVATSHARPIPSVTTTQRNALTGLVTGSSVYDTDQKTARTYDGAEMWADRQPTVKYVYDINDLPTAISGVITLAANTEYFFPLNTPISTTAEIVFSDRSFIRNATFTAAKMTFTAESGISMSTIILTNTTGACLNLNYSGSSTPVIRLAETNFVFSSGATIFGFTTAGYPYVLVIREASLNGTSLHLGSISGALLKMNDIQATNATIASGLAINNGYGVSISGLYAPNNPTAGSTLLTFGGTSHTAIELNTVVINNTGAYAFNFPSTTTYSGGVRVATGSISDKTMPFAAGSNTQKTIGFDFSDVKNIPNSTVTGVYKVDTAYTNVTTGGANYWALGKTAVGTVQLLERMTIIAAVGTYSSATYNGLEDTTLTLTANVNMEPATASKLLMAQFGIFKAEKRTVTFTNATNIVNETNTPRVNGDTISFASSVGTLALPINRQNLYYVVNKTANSFQVSLTPGGVAVDLTDDGSGTNVYQVVQMSGSVGRANITAANPMDVICQGLFPVSTGDEIFLFISNATDAVTITLNHVYYSIKE
jgi:hypothetical protein